jgi:hypothetical protein
MLQTIRTRFPWLPATGLLAAALLVVPAAIAKAPSPAYPPAGKALKVKTKDWVPQWWQWAYSMPESFSPLYDEVGTYAGLGQRSGVWFLAGAYNPSGVLTRTVTVPPGTSLFCPLLAYQCDDLGTGTIPLEELQACTTQFGDAVDVDSLFCIVDGVALTDLAKRRVKATTFSYSITPDTIPAGFGGNPGDFVFPVTSDGYWVMLKPLAPGNHTVRFGGTVGAPFSYDQDVTYNITVKPVP